MSDTQQNAPKAGGNPSDEQGLAPIQVNAQYIKDLSFEAPNTPAIFGEMQTGAPNIDIEVNLNASNMKDNLFEVVLHLRIKADLSGKTAFLVDLQYAGVFTLNVAEEHVQPVLFIECPRILFPFARNIIGDVTRDGGFPPMMLQPIDFVRLFRQRLEQTAPQGNA